MKLTNKQYEELYNEMIKVNEEAIDGEFFVSTKKQLIKEAIHFLIDEEKVDIDDIEDIESIKFELEIHWEGEGLYTFWGINFTNDFTLATLNKIFEIETNVDPLIFLEDPEAIEKEKDRWYEYDDYVYAIWRQSSNNLFKLISVDYRDEALTNDEIEHLQRNGRVATELRKLDNYDFYDFLRQYAILINL